MLIQTFLRAFNILKFEKNTYREIGQDNSSIYQSGIIMILASLVNVFLFKLKILPSLPGLSNQAFLPYMFLIWIFFNWCVFTLILLFVVKQNSVDQNLENKKVAFSLVGFSNSAEILKILIIFLPNFIVIISWGILMLVIASQVVGVKQIYNLKKISTAVLCVILSYIIQIFLIMGIIFILIKLAY